MLIDRITIELTHKCNLSCIFCYIKGSNYFSKTEIDIKTLKRFISQFKEKKHFYITGGEPTLSPHLLEILSYIKTLGHIAGLNTNGILFNKKILNELALINLEYVIFSVFGEKKTYTELAKTSNKNFIKLYENIKYFNSIKNKNTESIIGCVIIPDNINKMKKIYAFAKNTQSDRVLFEHLQFYYQSETENYNKARFGHLIMKKSEKLDFPYKEFLKQISHIINEKNGPQVDLRPAISINKLKKYYSKLKNVKKIRCSNINSIIVEPDGSIRLCVLYGKKIGDISEFDTNIKITQKNLLKGLPLTCYRCCHRFKIGNLKAKN